MNPRSRSFVFSKSRYLEGIQCHKLLWHRFNAKDRIPPPSANQQAIFDQGTQVGIFAQSLFPGGILIDAKHFEYAKILDQTAAALAARKPLFEPGFQYKNGFARADVLNPVGSDQWDIIEVKSSTEVKDVNLADIAFQRLVYEGAGLSIRNCRVLHINSGYVRSGEIDPNQLLTQVDVTADLAPYAAPIERALTEMVAVVGSKNVPDMPIGPHCSVPYVCPLMEQCWAFLPKHNVFTLSRIGRKAYDLLDDGIVSIADIPATFDLSENQRIQSEAVNSCEPHIDPAALESFLGSLRYPLYYLDFETFGTALPLFDGIRPYQQVPFQYSLHVVAEPGAQPKSFAYLSDGRSDPRPEILHQLEELLGDTGSIVAYNASFETGRLRDAVDVYPQYKQWFEQIASRVVDLIVPFRSYAYYHPDQLGSASIKAVLPALVGKSYDNMDIGDGGTASSEFLRVTFGDVDTMERRRVRGSLERYCELDTLAMILIVKRLEEFV